jgi:hypothetical protein
LHTFERGQQQEIYDSNFTKYCEEYSEWDMPLHRELYIKRSAVFYFVDVDILKAVFMANETANLNLLKGRLSFKFTLKKADIIMDEFVQNENVEINAYGKFGGHYVAFFQMNLSTANSKLERMYTNRDFDAMSLVVNDEKTGVHTKRPINVKIKRLLKDTAEKKEMAHCSKCFYTVNKDTYTDLEWWIQLHKMMGYDSIYFCYNIIEDEPSFHKTFGKYSDIFEIDTLKCVPNIITPSRQAYLKRQLDVSRQDFKQFEINTAFEVVFINECYMNNMDKYRYVTVADLDEFVLPRLVKQYDSLRSVQRFVSSIDYRKVSGSFADEVTCDANAHIENFFQNDLIPKMSNGSRFIDYEMSMQFTNTYFIFNNVVDELFRLLRARLRHVNVADFDSTTDTIIIEVVKREQLAELKFVSPYSFTISSRQELNYALDLMQLYERVVKPFLVEHKRELANVRFDRFFFQVGTHFSGKSVHNTRRSMDMWTHYAYGYMNVSNDNKLVEIRHGKGRFDIDLDFMVPRELAHLSHYRDSFNLDSRESMVPFSAFHFDLNYFKCFMIPILAKRKVS